MLRFTKPSFNRTEYLSNDLLLRKKFELGGHIYELHFHFNFKNGTAHLCDEK